MTKTEDGCVNCGLPCLGISCPNKNITVHYCDECGADVLLYRYDGGEYCVDCIIGKLEKV